ncbi:MAG TPA: hypothetical protein VF177_12890 [Anaerolineae bacterium]
MTKIIRTALPLVLFLSLVGAVYAQQDSEQRGTIRGAVYQDINGDGRCVNTGVSGENPVSGVNIEFVSSDEETVITLHTGDDGTYGLVAAGQSIWRVTAKPDPTKWVVTSENPRFVPVLPDSGLDQFGVNFCVRSPARAVISPARAVIVLPKSGAAAGLLNTLTAVAASLGTGFFVLGLGLEWRRRRSS